MSLPAAIAILALLLLGPLLSRRIEDSLEAYCFVLGVLAIGLAGGMNWNLATRALSDPAPISIAVIIAGVLFQYARGYLDRAVASMALRLSLPFATAFLVAVIASFPASLLRSSQPWYWWRCFAPCDCRAKSLFR